jgi:hypothetical protein
MAKRKATSEKLKNNKNAEKWSEEDAIVFMSKAIELSNDKIKKYDFIGEIARDMGSYRDIFTYLKDKFKSCKVLYNILSSNLEANCFSHGKSGDIVPAMAIMNLKANYKWSDRVETTLQGGDKPIETKQTIISLGNGTKPNETIS